MKTDHEIKEYIIKQSRLIPKILSRIDTMDIFEFVYDNFKHQREIQLMCIERINQRILKQFEMLRKDAA